MKLTDITIGTKLELEILDVLEGKTDTMLVSEFEWMEDENHAFIATPIHEGVVYPIRTGTTMNIYFIGEGALFSFKAAVVARIRKDNIELLKIEFKSGLEKQQRRNFFRFEWPRPIRYRVIDSLNSAHGQANPFISTVTRDLSGSGVCILTEEIIEINKIVECELLLEGSNVIKFYGKVIRQYKSDFEVKYKYEIGIWFKNIENKDREALISYIFLEQRRLRNKGLI